MGPIDSEDRPPGIGLVNGDCAAAPPQLPAAGLILTSPPYDNVREYGGYVDPFDFSTGGGRGGRQPENRRGDGVVVRDAVADGSETRRNFRQALAFMDLGLRLHQTLIYEASHYRAHTPNRTLKGFEHRFIFSSRAPDTANIPRDRPNITGGATSANYAPCRDGAGMPQHLPAKAWADYGRHGPIWRYITGGNHGIESCHPAILPADLARDRILSWTTPGGLVLDPMAGGGTTLRAEAGLGRRAIGVEINPAHCDLGPAAAGASRAAAGKLGATPKIQQNRPWRSPASCLAVVLLSIIAWILAFAP